MKNCKSKYLQPGHTKFACIIPMVLCSVITSYVDNQGTIMALGYIQQSFDITPSLAQWASTIYYLAQSSLAIPLSKVCEYLGQVYGLMLFNAIYLGMLIGCALIKNFYGFCAFHFVAGAASAACISARTTLIRKLANSDNVQRFMMFNNIILFSTSLIVPLACGFIIDYNWRVLYFVSAATALLTILLLIPYHNPTRPPKGQKFDYYGSGLSFLSIFAFNLSFTFLTYRQNTMFWVFLVGSIALLGSFLLYEYQVENPILPIKLLKKPVNALISMIFLGNYGAQGFNYMIPLMLKMCNQKSYVFGILSFIVAIGMVIIVGLIPMLAKRVLNKTIMVWGLSLSLLMYIPTMIVSNQLVGLCICFAILDLSYQLCNSIIIPVLTISTPQEHASQILALPMTVRTFSSSISTCLTACVLQLVYGKIKQTPDDEFDVEAWANAMRSNFAIFIVFLILALAALLFGTGHYLNEVHKKNFKQSKVMGADLMGHSEPTMVFEENIDLSALMLPRDFEHLASSAEDNVQQKRNNDLIVEGEDEDILK